MRPRKKDRHLPACIYLKSGSYYLVKGNKWHNLGKDLAGALKEYASRMASEGDTMPALLERYLLSVKVAKNTLLSYKGAVKKLSEIFAEYSPQQVTAISVQQVIQHYKDHPGTANILRSVLIGAFDLAFSEQKVDRNVARDTRPLKVARRTRYLTDEEFNAIRTHASPLVKCLMDFLYLTGQRIGDALKIRLSDISPSGIYIEQQKTKHRMVIQMTPELQGVINEAKNLNQSVKGMTLFHKRDGQPYLYDYIRTEFNKAAKLAGVQDARMHDIRAKTGTDADKNGMDSMALLGHKSESSHNRYLRSKEIPTVSAMSFRSSKTKSA